jgi:alpha,alpha-trehalase
VIIDPADHDAVIFDLDGVLTRTAAVHAAAWKALFDRYLLRRADRPFVPFDSDSEYRRHVDGKPRYDGVRDLLASRGITLPRGSPDDPPGRETVCGLGNRKNEIFRRRLARQGVEVYESAVRCVDELRAAGVRVGVVTSSKNGEAVLEAAGLRDRFPVRVDGLTLERLHLAGKPAPDVFLEAARRLEVAPARAVVVEDAAAGVEAGRRGGFGLVVGVDRGGGGELSAHAHVVVDDLSRVRVQEQEEKEMTRERSSDELPSALEAGRLAGELHQRLEGRVPALFLDYDGTLTPIVERPEDAALPEATARVLRRLARRWPVAVISGRGLDDVRRLVGIDELYYAGSHGYRIAGPAGSRIAHQAGDRYLPAVERAEAALRGALDGIEGAQVERKEVAVAVHLRRVAPGRRPEVEAAARVVAADHEGTLALSRGKLVLELRPDLDWHKGRAVHWLLGALELEGPRTLPIYIGDDTTDEDAFTALEGRGIGILVRDDPRPTAASHALEDPDEVRRFLEALEAARSER